MVEKTYLDIGQKAWPDKNNPLGPRWGAVGLNHPNTPVLPEPRQDAGRGNVQGK